LSDIYAEIIEKSRKKCVFAAFNKIFDREVVSDYKTFVLIVLMRER
jgi:hypothetical protein